jgi:probable rRNA maturation factor
MTPMQRRAEIDVIVADARWEALDIEALAARAAEAVLARLGIEGPAEIALLATSDAEVARLNAAHRGKPAPTNVLSWPATALAPPAPGTAPPPPRADATGSLALGDVALAYETCTREARDAGRPAGAHVTHLVVHGILHLLGYDHISDADAALMERLEVEILATLGHPDPHGAGRAGPAEMSGGASR